MVNRAAIFFLGILYFSSVSFIYPQERADALQLYRDGYYERAVEVCLAELQETPRNMDSFVVLGWSLLRLGRFREAVEFGLRALEISRYDVRVIQTIGEAHFRLGNNLEALKYLEEYTVIAPTGHLIAIVFYQMGEILLRLGEYNRADIAISTALFHNPRVALWWARLGYAREQAKDHRFAMEAYTNALQLNPNLTDALRGRERVQSQLNQVGPRP